MSEGVFGDHAGAAEAMAELAVLFSYLEALDSLQVTSKVDEANRSRRVSYMC